MLTLENIIEAVADEYRFTKLELLGRGRHATLDEARGVAALIVRCNVPTLSWKKLGVMFDRRSPSGAKGIVLTAMRHVAQDERVQGIVRKLEHKLELPSDVVRMVLELGDDEDKGPSVEDVAQTPVYQRGEI